jgi:hypothetical protein
MKNSTAVILTNEKQKKDNSLRTGIFLNNIWQEYVSNVENMSTYGEQKEYMRKEIKTTK